MHADALAPVVGCCRQGGGTIPQGRLSKHFHDGVLFSTYSLLISGGPAPSSRADGDANEADASMPAIARSSRLQQFVDWLREGRGGCLIIFDECHKAKNLVATKGEGLLGGLDGSAASVLPHVSVRLHSSEFL
jgi:P-loop containing NTP hydrolase pore-1